MGWSGAWRLGAAAAVVPEVTGGGWFGGGCCLCKLRFLIPTFLFCSWDGWIRCLFFSFDSWVRVSLRCYDFLFVFRCLRRIPLWGNWRFCHSFFIPPDARFFFEEPEFPCCSCFRMEYFSLILFPLFFPVLRCILHCCDCLHLFQVFSTVR